LSARYLEIEFNYPEAWALLELDEPSIVLILFIS